jgi:hypothetical protein
VLVRPLESKEEIQKHFDWRAFVELYPESVTKGGVKSREDAIQYFLKNYQPHFSQTFPRKNPLGNSFDIAKKKLSDHILLLNERKVPPPERSLVIYHIGWLTTENSFDVTTNNIRIFLSSVIDDCLFYSLENKSAPRAFYWINIVGGAQNALFNLFQPHADLFPNIALLDWSIVPSDMYLHFRTLDLLVESGFLSSREYLRNNFTAIVFLNNEARGPLAHRFSLPSLVPGSSPSSHVYLEEEGRGRGFHWLELFQFLLGRGDNQLVGPSFSCELGPHVQTHVFAIRPSFIGDILRRYRPPDDTGATATSSSSSSAPPRFRYWRQLIRHYELGLTQLARSPPLNHSVHSFLYFFRQNRSTSFSSCLAPPLERSTGFRTDLNPVRWCDLSFEEVVFVKWGGNAFRQNGLVCERAKQQMEAHLPVLVRSQREHYLALRDKQPQLGILSEGDDLFVEATPGRQVSLSLSLSIPETLRGGVFHDLFKQFYQERATPVHPQALSSPFGPVSVGTTTRNATVCLVTHLHGNYPFHQYKLSRNEKRRKLVTSFFLETLKDDYRTFLAGTAPPLLLSPSALDLSVNPSSLSLCWSDSDEQTNRPELAGVPGARHGQPAPTRTTAAGAVPQPEETLHHLPEIPRQPDSSSSETAGPVPPGNFCHLVVLIVLNNLLWQGSEFRSLLDVFDSFLATSPSLLPESDGCEKVVFVSVSNLLGSRVIELIRAHPRSQQLLLLPTDSKKFIYQGECPTSLSSSLAHCLPSPPWLIGRDEQPGGAAADFPLLGVPLVPLASPAGIHRPAHPLPRPHRALLCGLSLAAAAAAGSLLQ